MRIALLAATALTGSLIAATAHAQTTENGTTPPVGPSTSIAEADAPADTQTIVITGSRIRRPNIEANAPVTSISGTEFL